MLTNLSTSSYIPPFKVNYSKTECWFYLYIKGYRNQWQCKSSGLPKGYADNYVLNVYTDVLFKNMCRKCHIPKDCRLKQ